MVGPRSGDEALDMFGLYEDVHDIDDHGNTLIENSPKSNQTGKRGEKAGFRQTPVPPEKAERGTTPFGVSILGPRR
jgi:hypothetical protein